MNKNTNAWLHLMNPTITHRSKIGLEILIPIILILGFLTSLMIIHGVWFGLLICGLVITFILQIYLRTYYQITPDHHLLVRCGFFESYLIDVNDIEWIKETKELSNAPALSIDRLEIGFKGGRILISPKDKKKFTGDLKMVNSRIWFAK